MADYARGATFKRLREDRHLSQEDAAHEIKVSVKTLRSWEHDGGIKWDNAKHAAKFYGVAPEDLVDRELPESDEERHARLDEELSELRDGLAAALDALSRLVPREAEAVARQIEETESAPEGPQHEPARVRLAADLRRRAERLRRPAADG